MLSRRERKKLETRARILRAALELFSEHGYDEVRIEDIRDRADVANATFFAHFPTKASLISAFGVYLFSRVESRLSEFQGGAMEQLEVLRAVYFDEWADYAGVLSRIHRSLGSSEANTIIQTGPELVALIEKIILAGQGDGIFSKSASPHLVAHCLAGGWRAVMDDFLDSGDLKTAKIANRQVLDIVMDGIK